MSSSASDERRRSSLGGSTPSPGARFLSPLKRKHSLDSGLGCQRRQRSRLVPAKGSTASEASPVLRRRKSTSFVGDVTLTHIPASTPLRQGKSTVDDTDSTRIKSAPADDPRNATHASTATSLGRPPRVPCEEVDTVSACGASQDEPVDLSMLPSDSDSSDEGMSPPGPKHELVPSSPTTSASDTAWLSEHAPTSLNMLRHDDVAKLISLLTSGTDIALMVDFLHVLIKKTLALSDRYALDVYREHHESIVRLRHMEGYERLRAAIHALLVEMHRQWAILTDTTCSV
ncbi:hypothetical protein SDRG_03117 [Saprolegnia diclina VS20]|uniref:Uncharacterized protein n=1 Tax=Saprolegnia diclina (strain VS20) TaxID=1156394 RepID=T0QNL2_SAPDV|nr:hypothetical protein SDRG_03117 [Saprolegnia diclina VS20]EQC39689.1 hypothetical protein SDRG_03117 [Saprolegnia diclina VS20]|eukprot:XP_008606961.1 hypothetical protein SDRG_03117 [Saprolegnia diclina VS20]